MPMLRLICQEIVREAGRRNDNSPGGRARAPGRDRIRAADFPRRPARLASRNDKWMFPRVGDRRASRANAGATLTVYPIHDNEGQFRRQFTYMMQAYGGLAATDLPAWAAEIFDRYDREAFSPQMLTDLAMEGCIIFAKPKRSPASRGSVRQAELAC